MTKNKFHLIFVYCKIIILVIINDQVIRANPTTAHHQQSRISTNHTVTSPKDKPYRIVSLFSSCLNITTGYQTSPNRTEHEARSAMIQHLSDYLFTKDCMVPDSCPGLNFTDIYDYEAYDVCHDHERLVEILIELNLNRKYFPIPTTTTKNNSNGDEGLDSMAESNNIVMVFTYLDQLMIDMVYSLLLWNRYFLRPEILLFREGTVPTHPDLRGSFPHKGIAYKQSNTISTYFPDVGWDVLVVVLIKIGEKKHEIEVYAENYEATLLSIHKQDKVCVVSDVVETQEQLLRTVDKLRRTNYQTPIILYGDEKYQIEVFKRTEGDLIYRHKWILNDISSGFINNDIYAKLRGTATILVHHRLIYFENKMFVAKNIRYFPDLFNLDTAGGNTCSSAECKAIYGSCLGLFAAMKIRMRQPGTLRFKRIHATQLVRYYNQGYYKIALHRSEHIRMMAHHDIPKYRDVLQSNRCVHPKCGPGFYEDFGQIKETIWNQSHGWRCTACPVNTIKTWHGSGRCVPCSLPFFTSNEENTLCYDPYKKVSFTIDMVSVQFCLATSGFLCLTTLLTLVVFMRNKDTWIVQSTDLTISTIHLMLLMLNFIIPNVSFGMDSSWIYWTVYLVSISLVDCCCLSIVLVKSKKLLQAFNSKVRVNRSEALRTTYHQISIVILNMILTTVLFVFSIQMQELKEQSIRNPSNLELVEYCEHDLHIVLQILFLLSLQIACLVPAYQGRNLPSVFNNAMAIVYASFVMVVCSLVFLPVYLFQADPRHKYIVEHLTFQCLGLAQMSFLYWPKVYVLLFQPEKKSKQYLRAKTFSFSPASNS